MTQQKAKKTGKLHTTPTSELIPDVYGCAEFLADWNQSLLTFYLGRIQQYMKIPLDVSGHSSSDEYVRSHEQFLGKMIEDYVDQSEKLLKIVRNDNQETDDASRSGYEASILKAQEDAAKIIKQAKVQAERIIAAAGDQAEQTASKPAPEQTASKPAPEPQAAKPSPEPQAAKPSARRKTA